MSSFPGGSLCEERKRDVGYEWKMPDRKLRAASLYIITEILRASKGRLLLDQGCCIDNSALLTIPSSNIIPVPGVLIDWLRHQLDRGRRAARI